MEQEKISHAQRKKRKLVIYTMLILEQNPHLDRQKIEDWRDGIYYEEFENLLAKWGILDEFGESNHYTEQE